MEKLYFNTGVKPQNTENLREYETFINGEKHIEFYVSDIPKNGILKFICENEPINSIINQKPYYEYRKILKGGISGFAIFFIAKFK